MEKSECESNVDLLGRMITDFLQSKEADFRFACFSVSPPLLLEDGRISCYFFARSTNPELSLKLFSPFGQLALDLRLQLLDWVEIEGAHEIGNARQFLDYSTVEQARANEEMYLNELLACQLHVQDLGMECLRTEESKSLKSAYWAVVDPTMNSFLLRMPVRFVQLMNEP